MHIDSFSGEAARLKRGHRSADDVLVALKNDPRVSTWDMSELSWLRAAIEDLERRGLIVALDEPYPWHRYAILKRRKDKAMNFKLWLKWVAEINSITGGSVIELGYGPINGMTIRVRWMLGEKLFGYEHAMSFEEIERMYEVVQPCVLESITNAVRKMFPNVELMGAHK